MLQKWEEIRHTWIHGIVFRHVKNKKLNMWSPKNKLSTLRFCKIIFSYKYIWVSCSQEWTHLITKLDTCAYGDLAWTCVRPKSFNQIPCILRLMRRKYPILWLSHLPHSSQTDFYFIRRLMSMWPNTIAKHNVIRINLCNNKLIPYFYNKIVPRWLSPFTQFFIKKKKKLWF